MTVKSNFNFKKIDKRDVEDLIFDEFIRPVGEQALRDVKKTFKTGKDIKGKSFKPLTTKYKNSKFRNKDKILVFMGDLEKSIGFSTNRKNLTASVGSKLEEEYPIFHLTGEGVPRRRWIYTQDEIPTIFEDAGMLKNVYEKSANRFTQGLVKKVKTKLRTIGKTVTLDLDG
tara:strand:+ start:361 stop:873 length:513 start_codon:yes stop_codon:yes gene_type:complete